MPKPPGDPPQRWREVETRGATGVNEQTGEIIELGTIRGMQPIHSRKARREIRFMLIDIDAMPQLEMSKGEWKLFWMVVQHTDRERGEARISTAELARQIGWKAPNASRALSKMAKRGILIRITTGAWQVNPRLMSRSSVVKWELDQNKAPTIDWVGTETEQ